MRTTVQALAAVLGGTQSLHTNSWDEALALPSEGAVQIALRTQQILAYESGSADCVDPLAGSYFVEWLTNAVEGEVSRYLDEIENLGGALAAIEQGYMQRQIQESSYQYQKDIEQGKRAVIGVNMFASPHPKVEGLLRVDPAEAAKQKQRLAAVKSSRDNAKVATLLQNLENAARGTENTMPITLECVEAYATLGEICDVLRGVFGEQKEEMVF